MRSLARYIQASSLPSHVVIIDGGHGRGLPGGLAYELAPETKIAVFGEGTNLSKLEASLVEYDDVWLVFSYDSPTAGIRDTLLNQMENSGRVKTTLQDKFVYRFQKA